MDGARDRIRTGDLFVTNEVLYRLSYTGRWWGCLDSNQGTQRERIYSPPQLPLCHIPIPFSSAPVDALSTRTTLAEEILRSRRELVNEKYCIPRTRACMPMISPRIRGMKKATPQGGRGRVFLEPAEGVEPPTHGLQNRCSAIEPCWRGTHYATGRAAGGSAPQDRVELGQSLGGKAVLHRHPRVGAVAELAGHLSVRGLHLMDEQRARDFGD